MKIVWRIPGMLLHIPTSSRKDVGHFQILVVRKWYGPHVSEPTGEWNKFAEVVMLNFAENGRPVFRATSASER